MKKKKIEEILKVVADDEDDIDESENVVKAIDNGINKIIDVFDEFQGDLPEALHRILDTKKINLPKVIDVKVINSKDFKEDEKEEPVEIKRTAWIDEITKSLKDLRQTLDEIKRKEIKLPTKAKDAISVRLSDGEEFYKAIAEVYQTAMAPGGGGNVPKIVVSGGVQAVPIVNPDGTNISMSSTSSSIGTQTAISDTSTPTLFLSSNNSRIGATITNDSSASLFVLLGSGTVSSTNYTVRMTQYSYYELPFNYKGEIYGVWSSDPNDGAARITELT